MFETHPSPSIAFFDEPPALEDDSAPSAVCRSDSFMRSSLIESILLVRAERKCNAISEKRSVVGSHAATRKRVVVKELQSGSAQAETCKICG